jgi:4-amino-4-deoxy-L-arabinose transferase-like glycosyltransferase
MKPVGKQFSNLPISVALAAIFALTFLLRMNFWNQPLQMDEAVYSYVGWGMLDGLVPYKDVFDHKPPGIYLLYALAFLLFGPKALSIKVFATIYTLGTVLAVFLVGRKMAGERVGCMAALLFGIFSCGPKIEGGGVNTEIFLVLPYTLAAYSLLRTVETAERRHYLFFGLWTGLASIIKQVALVNLCWLAAYWLVCIWRDSTWSAVANIVRNAVLVMVGVALPWLPFVLYFYLSDAIKDFFYWQVGFNFNYIYTSYQDLPVTAIFIEQMKGVLSENGLLWLLSLAGIGFLYQQMRNPGIFSTGSEPKPLEPMIFFLMATWPIFCFFAISLGGRYYGHYFIQIIPSLSILGGAGLAGLVRSMRVRGLAYMRHPLSLMTMAALASAFSLFVMTDAPYYLKYNGDQISYHQYRTSLFSVTRFIGRYLGKRTQPDDLIYVWRGDPEINFYALRKTPSPFLVHWNIDETDCGIVMKSLRQRPPEYIVAMYDMSIFPALEDYVKENYQEETSTALEKLREIYFFEVYRRKAT